MKLPDPACSRLVLLLLVAAIGMPGAAAFSVDRVTVIPSDVVNPGDPVNVSCTVYAASGTAFPSYDDLEFVTELDDPVWTYLIEVNGVENSRPAERGKYLTISGFELKYQDKDEVVVRVNLKARIPASAPTGATKTFLKVQELDARSNVIQSSVVQVNHLVGTPTPTPTPAYGKISITSTPAGANVYVDNVIRGITPLTMDSIPNGAHPVLLRLDGYEDYTDIVTVMADARQVNADLVSKASTPVPTREPNGQATPSSDTTTGITPAGTVAHPSGTPAPSTGTLSVTTDPPGALIYVDGQMKGVTPATIPGLSPGSHSITLIMDGYQDLKTTTEITAGTTAEFVTGLQKRKGVPGFTAAGALCALSAGALLFAGRKRE